MLRNSRGAPRRTLLRGGTIVTASGEARGDVLVAGEEIEAVGDVGDVAADEIVDATGKLVLPGAIDAHTHLDMEVGATRSADDFLTGTRAAACGGTTCVIDFATAYRGETVAQGLATWHAKAGGRAVIDYGFHLSLAELTRPADDVVADALEAGVTSFKLYMTYPERLMVSDDVIARMLAAAGRVGALVCLHCEDDATVARRRAEALAAGHTEPRWHAWSRPPSAEADAVRRAARMAADADAPCYVVHLSSADALAEVRAAREAGEPFYAETCPQYLYLSADRLDGPPERAARYVCAPPLRDGRHRDELWEGLARGHLQVVSTDHCPFDSRAKDAGLGGGGWRSFAEIPGGLPGIEMRLSLVYQKVVEGSLTRAQWVDRCCTAPARIFGLYPRKGALLPGSDADVVVFDPRARRPLVPERMHMNVDYTGYEDVTVEGWPALVLSRGRVVARDGEPVGEPGWGRYVARGPTEPPS
ncbi:MAG TPA: dihydropyrimidinase [Actinomycetota bacterium]|nr:dihydropyrimidinase [Actinomycetota bacterium]